MKKEKKPKVVITADVKAELYATENERGRTAVRVLHWIADGKDTGAKYEKRSFYKKKDGTFSDFGAAKGFNKQDLEYIVANWNEIKLFF